MGDFIAGSSNSQPSGTIRLKNRDLNLIAGHALSNCQDQAQHLPEQFRLIRQREG